MPTRYVRGSSPAIVANMIAELGLKRIAQKIINHATNTGYISLANIAEMIPVAVARDEELLVKITRQVSACFSLLGIVVIPADMEQKLKTNPGDKQEKSSEDETLELIHEDVPMDSNKLLKIYKREVGKFELLSIEDERFLSGRALQGDLNSRNTLVEHNLRLSMYTAHRFGGRGVGLEYLDLVQEGNDGLIDAAKRYDGSLGFKFSGYATKAIREHIVRGIQNYSGTVRLPVHIHGKCWKIKEVINKLFQKLGREPNAEEISEDISMSTSEVTNLLRLIRSTTVRLDQPIGEEEEGENYHGFIADISTLPPDQLLEAKEQLEAIAMDIREFLEKVSTRCLLRDFKMFKIRYGLNDGSLQKMTMEAIANRFDLSRQRVYQVIERFWNTLKITNVITSVEDTEEWLDKQIEHIKELENIVGIVVEL